MDNVQKHSSCINIPSSQTFDLIYIQESFEVSIKLVIL
jgi:hypothetical protein